MARISRKHIEGKQEVVQKTYKVGIYARLSVEDIQKKESDSINVQVDLISKYVDNLENSYLVEVYKDVNQTGTNFERPSFNKLMLDVKSGKINCIVVKDLSRFGRNFLEIGNYLEKVFPFMGVRFISINDNYDSENLKGDDSLIVPLKNLLNEFYARDISKKIKNQYEMKRKNGEFCGTFAPYGYIKEGSKLVIDCETVDVVRYIFNLVLEGYSDISICKKLNELNIPSPSMYRYNKGIVTSDKYKECKYWYKSAIKRITENPVHIGNIGQGKYITNFMQNGVRNDETFISIDTHTPIISVEIFNKVQEIRNNRSTNYANKIRDSKIKKSSENILKGLVYCGDCNRPMIRKKVNRANNSCDYRYLCNIYEQVDNNSCSKKSFLESELLEILYTQIKIQIEYVVDIEKVLSSSKKNIVKKNINCFKDEIKSIEGKIKKVELKKSMLYEDYVLNILDKETYIFIKNKFTKEIEILSKQKDELVLKNEENINHNKKLKKYDKIETDIVVNEKIIKSLIEKILIKSKKEVEIVFKYKDEYILDY